MSSTNNNTPRRRLVIYEYEEDPNVGSNSNNGGTSSTTPAAAAAGRAYHVFCGGGAPEIREIAAYIANAERNKEQQQQQRWPTSTTINKILSDLFLPVGYPATVRAGYLEYQVYDSIQGLCSYLRGVLCSAAVLEAAGVGNAEATALAAATTWALKDGLAMAGGLLYSYAVSDKLDAHVKEFRLFADIINDVGFLFDMMAPWCGPKYFFQVSSAAVLCKTMCGISAGATKGSITQHFAMAGNMADVNAKESTQETMVSLTGMLLGIYAARTLQSYSNEKSSSVTIPAAIINWTIFTVLTLIHIWANWKGVTLLRMRTLNRARAEICLSKVIQQMCAAGIDKEEQDGDDKIGLLSTTTASLAQLIPSPDQVHESLLYSVGKVFVPGRLKLGVPLTTILQRSEDAARNFLVQSASAATQRYAVTLTQDGNNHVLVSLLVGSSSRDELKAYVHASILMQLAQLRMLDNDKRDAAAAAAAVEGKIRDLSSRIVAQLFGNDDDDNDCPIIEALRQKGWDVDGRFYLGFSRRRSQWTAVVADAAEDDSKKDN